MNIDCFPSGQKKFVSLYIAFIINKEILILDEPFSYLDEDHIKWLNKMILNYQNKIIIVAHTKDLSHLNFDKIIKLESDNNVNYDL